AEDGIRDFHVTGVQTRALPISIALALLGIGILISVPMYLVTGVARESQELVMLAQQRMREVRNPGAPSLTNEWLHKLPLDELVEIGRASCRERVQRAEGAVTGK